MPDDTETVVVEPNEFLLRVLRVRGNTYLRAEDVFSAIVRMAATEDTDVRLRFEEFVRRAQERIVTTSTTR